MRGKRSNHKGHPSRIRWVALAFGLAGISLALRALQLHLVWDLGALLRSQQSEKITVKPRRGAILDRNGLELAISMDSHSVAIRPKKVTDPPLVVTHLSQALGMDPGKIEKALGSEEPFVWVRRFVNPAEHNKVRSHLWAGIEIEPESRRVYPLGRIASSVIGFAGTDSKGLEGVELFYDSSIRGETGTLRVLRDAKGRSVLTGGVEKAEVPTGSKIYLTLDVKLQRVLERELEDAVSTSKAKGGMAIAVDPQTGAILAMASFPWCDLNDASRCGPTALRNRVVVDTFEPGSTFKMVLAAAALEERAVHLGDMFHCENGKYAFAGRVIHDAHPYGQLSFEGIIQKSSNIGVTKVAQKLGARTLHQYIRRFGFGSLTSMDLPGEVAGSVRPLRLWQPIDLATQAFGQGIAVTGLQMVMAYAAVANGGLLMKPYIVDRIEDPSGRTQVKNPTLVRRVISEETARTLTSILELVVEEGGTGTKARLEGFRVAGKTGTAQKVNPATRSYVGGKRIASFVGYAPSDSPRLAVLVVIDEPSTNVYGGLVAAPSFHNIAQEFLLHMDVAPDAPPLRQARQGGEPTRATISEESQGQDAPFVVGLSSREAILKLVSAGLRLEQVTVEGSGYVVAQTMRHEDPESPGNFVLTLAPVAPQP